MNRYVGLLRGVNVGTTRLAMADLRRLVADLGHADVQTYLQSGNVVFGSTSADAARLAKGIEQALAWRAGVDRAGAGPQRRGAGGGGRRQPVRRPAGRPHPVAGRLPGHGPDEGEGRGADRARQRERRVHRGRSGGLPALPRRRVRPVEVHQRLPGEAARCGGDDSQLEVGAGPAGPDRVLTGAAGAIRSVRACSSSG
ncbi:DUF1697 domain-containing protein [Micromonospora sp. 4G55]|nr:DUF1697 domain-containing protein [Micromonospora sp. 4G55]